MPATNHSDGDLKPLISSKPSTICKNSNHNGAYGSVSTSHSLSTPSHHIQTFKRRWWILLAFSLCCISQSAQWNAWGPITDAVQIVYNWDPSVVARFPAMADGGLFFFGLFVMYLVEEKGLRFGTVVSACFLVATMALWNLAMGLKCSWLVVVGAVFNGIASSLTQAAAPLVSVTWFPVNERTTATAIGTAASAVGTGISFLAGPYLSGPNVTSWEVHHKANLSAGYMNRLEDGVSNTMYFNTGLAVLCFLCVMIYYPTKPPKPPSMSANVERVNFRAGLGQLASKSQYWLLGGAYFSLNASLTVWLSWTSVTFRDLGISEATAGWMGFLSLALSSIVSIFMSVFIDHFKRKTKLILVIMNLLCIVAVLVLVCLQQQYLHVPQAALTGLLYTLVGLIGAFIYGVFPLYYELACEIAYPVHEGLACAVFLIVCNLFEMLYLLLFLNQTLAKDTRWTTWLLLGACVFALPMLLVLRESFARLDLEEEDDRSGRDEK